MLNREKFIVMILIQVIEIMNIQVVIEVKVEVEVEAGVMFEVTEEIYLLKHLRDRYHLHLLCLFLCRVIAQDVNRFLMKEGVKRSVKTN